MTSHASPLPVGVDPLIAEAKRRMRRRRISLALGLAGVAALAAALTFAMRPGGTDKPPGGGPPIGSAAPGVYRLGWTLPVTVKGQHVLDMRVYWLRVSPARWSFRVAVSNPSNHTFRPNVTGKTGWGLSTLTLAERENPTQCSWARCRDFGASAFTPALPRILAPGTRWSGVVSGIGRLPGHWWAAFDLGYYRGWPRFAGGSGFGFGPTLLRSVNLR